MTDNSDTPKTPKKPSMVDRIAKVIARAGVASRREAERMILEGRVTVNGQKIASPALDVMPSDRITVDGKALEAPQETRLWLYYKPVGLVTSEADEKGRQTVFDALPRDLPRVMSIGRLDLNSEGLLLLTNDGELKRRLELPATGWLRRYRVRVNGQPNDLTFAPLRRGATIDGEDFAPMEIKLDSQQGANAWLTVGIREGRNREIRRAMMHVGLQVNRLIRIGYGPFKLTGMEENEVKEIRRRVLRDQLGGLLTGDSDEREPRSYRERSGDGERGDRRDAGKTDFRRDDARGGDRQKPFGKRDDMDRPDRDGRGRGERKPFDKRNSGSGSDQDSAGWGGNRKSDARGDGDRRKPFGKRGDAGRSGHGDRNREEGKTFSKRENMPRPDRDGDTRSERKPYGKRNGSARPDRDRTGGYDKTGYGKRAEGGSRRKEFSKSGDDRRQDHKQGKPEYRSGTDRKDRGFKPAGKGPGARGQSGNAPRGHKPGGPAGRPTGPRRTRS